MSIAVSEPRNGGMDGTILVDLENTKQPSSDGCQDSLPSSLRRGFVPCGFASLPGPQGFLLGGENASTTRATTSQSTTAVQAAAESRKVRALYG